LSQEETYRELSKADVVVHYSNWDVLPTVVLEAMALGKPVVGSLAADQITPGVSGFIARNEDELMDYTHKLLKSKELRVSLGKQARKVVEEKYSLSRLITQLEAGYVGSGPC
jgi:glycosyltransferase involved in cell wall biosynthesis